MRALEEAPQNGNVLRLDWERYYPVGDWQTAFDLIRWLASDGSLFYASDCRLLSYENGQVVREANSR